MRVFIAGATGVLGRRLVADCTDRGHDVVGLTRDDRGDEIVHEHGGTPHRGDILDRDSLREGAAGADVLVHAATKIPVDTNPDDEDWEQNDRVRCEGAENMVAAAGAVGADRLLMQSIVWLARNADGSAFDETSDPNPDRVTRSALDAEWIVTEGADEHGYDPLVLRGGWFYAHDTAHTRMFGKQLLARRLPIIGRGLLGRTDARLSFVHVDDAASAFAAAVEGDATGTFHVVDDEPTTYGEFLRTFADELDAKQPFRVPAWLARLFVAGETVSLLTRPMPTSNDKLREAFDWEPGYPTVREGLTEVVERWRADGTLQQTGGEVRWTETAEPWRRGSSSGE